MDRLRVGRPRGDAQPKTRCRKGSLAIRPCGGFAARNSSCTADGLPALRGGSAPTSTLPIFRSCSARCGSGRWCPRLFACRVRTRCPMPQKSQSKRRRALAVSLPRVVAGAGSAARYVEEVAYLVRARQPLRLILLRNCGGLRAFTVCSKPYAILSRTGSLQARPKNERPTGSPKKNPAGTVMCG